MAGFAFLVMKVCLFVAALLLLVYVALNLLGYVI